MKSMTFDDFTDLENREQEEEQDALETVVPPADIVAFTEQRSCADLYRMCQKGQIDLYPQGRRITFLYDNQRYFLEKYYLYSQKKHEYLDYIEQYPRSAS